MSKTLRDGILSTLGEVGFYGMFVGLLVALPVAAIYDAVAQWRMKGLEKEEWKRV